MLSIVIPYRKVFERLGTLDQSFDCPLGDDWKFASLVCEKLELFYQLTTLFYGIEYVTANIFFPKVCEIKLKINSWKEDENEIIRKMSIAMIEKYDKYWSDIQGLMALAVILDPCLKMIMLEACYIALLGEDEADKYVKKSYELLTELMHEYHVQTDQEGVGTSSFGAASSTVSAAAMLSIFKSLAVNKQTSSLSKAKNELDRYLDEEPLPHNESEYFDVLGWWKVAGTRFPTLRMITRDILAIPVTTGASESAFSTGCRVLSEHRSRLTPQMVEALMCSQSWLRHSLKGNKNGHFLCFIYSKTCNLQAAATNIDDDNVDTFWSCLEDIEEEMKEESCITSVDSD